MTDPDHLPVSATLGEYLSKISVDAESLRIDVHNAEQARRRATAVSFVLMCVLGLLMLFVLFVANQNNAIADQTRQTNARMADCTTPGGTCYTEGAKRTGEAIGSILRAQIALGECTRLYPGEAGPAFDEKLRECVYDRITHDPGPAVAPATPPAGAPSPQPATSASGR